MRVVNKFPHSIEEHEHVWIPLRDGCRLSARIWKPEGGEPVPAVVEYIPYRKRDAIRERDEPIHRYLAGHGYAAVRIDVRGTGQSEGLLTDEYTEEELEDGVEALRWLAAQPWCTGRIGMLGKSWGGINALQIAAKAPPELGAVVTVCSTDDRYADDAHYMGGCLLNENAAWGSVLFTLNARPPDPALSGEDWREIWRERLEHAPLFLERWLRHQRRDDYWKRGSVREDYGAVRCPVFAVGGWADAYTNAVFRLLEGLRVPRKGLIGPWAHLYPHTGLPRPGIGFLQECLRWFDRWLRDRETGLPDEPMLRVWMEEAAPAMAFHDERPGRWVAEPAWPSPSIGTRTFRLGPGALIGEADVGATAGETPRSRTGEPAVAPPAGAEGLAAGEGTVVRSPLSTGLAGGVWCPFGLEGQMPRDQNEDDRKSAVFDSAHLPSRMEILGAPVVTAEVSCDRPLGFLAVRLLDVHPGGASERVSYGVLNLTHRNGHETPEPVVPGERFAARIPLKHAGHAFAPGHRIRLAFSTSYFPIVWPSPEIAAVTLFPSSSAVELPVRPVRPQDDSLPPLPPPEAGPPLEVTDLHPGGTVRTTERDPETGEFVVTVSTDEDDEGGVSLTRLEAIGLTTGHAVSERYAIAEGDPLSARTEIVHRTVSRRDGWSVGVETRTRLTAGRRSFKLEADLEAFEDGECVFSRSWERTIPRDGV